MTASLSTTEYVEDLAEPAVRLRLVPPIGEPERRSHAFPPEARDNAIIEFADDSAWLAALAKGEDAALTRLYRDHHEAVRALVRRLLSRSAEIEDVVHDVFVAAPRAFRHYRGEGTVRAFVFSIAVHQVQHHVRAMSRRRSWLERFRLSPVHMAPPPTPEAETARSELAERLQRALDSLSFDHRTAVVLCEVEELTSVEAARALDVPEATVRTRLHHAKKKLRALLDAEDTRE